MSGKPTYEELEKKVKAYEHAESMRKKARQDLRKKAEEIVAHSSIPGDAREGSRDNKRDNPIDELRIYQAELEMQNQELRAAQTGLERSRDRLFSLFHFAPVAYLLLDKTAIIADVNKEMRKMLGRERSDLLKRPFSQFIDPLDEGIFFSRYKSFFKHPQRTSIEIRLKNKTDRPRYVELSGRFLELDHDVPEGSGGRLLVAVTDITEKKEAEERERHVRQVLQAIRTINKLITTETDPGRLIELACANLTEKMGYHNAWVAILDLFGKATVMTASSGMDEDFPVLRSRLEKGVFSRCMNRALAQDDLVVVADPPSECLDCPLSSKYEDNSGFIRRLKFDGHLFGVLSVSVPKAYSRIEEEQDLFREVTRDLSFALSQIEKSNALRLANDIVSRSPAVAFVWKTAEGWPVEFASENTERIFGRTARDFLSGKVSYASVIHPDDLDRVVREVAESSADPRIDSVVHAPYRIVRPDGRSRWIEDMTYILRGEDGSPMAYEGILLDITEKKKSEEVIDNFFEQPMNLHVIAGMDGKIHRVNKGWRSLLGHSPDELIGSYIQDFIHPSDIKATLAELEKQGKGESTLYFENRYRHKNGTYRLLAWSSTALSEQKLVFGVANDITDRTIAQKSLRESERKHRIISELSSDYFYILSVGDTGRISVDWFSESFQRVTTYSPEEICDFQDWLSHIHPDDHGKLMNKLHLLIANNSVTCQYRLFSKDGDERWLGERLRPVWDQEKKRVVKVYGAVRDMTKEKKTELALRDALEQLEAIFESAMVGILVTHNRIVTKVNNRMAHMIGYRTDEILGKTPEQLHLSHERFVEFGEKYYSRLSEKEIVQLEYPMRHKKGHVLLCQFSGRAIAPPDLAKGVVWIIDDITERKKTEEKLAQMRKAESLSRMAAAIAHNFNNILMATIGNLDLARMDLSPESEVSGFIEEAEKSARRAASISQLMLTYLGMEPGKPGPLDLSLACEDLIGRMGQDVPKGIELRTRFQKPGPVVEADLSRIEQIVQALFTNSLEALEDKEHGRIDVSVDIATSSNIAEANRFPENWKKTTDLYARLTFCDSGRGMDQNTVGKIFDPFYTDKFTGRGLGLAAVLGIVKACKGCITVDTEPGKGSTFRLHFPLSAATSALPREKTYLPENVAKGEKILLVEDQDIVRKTAQAMLERLGYAVIVAKDGAEALEIFIERQSEIRLIISDLSMPRMNGWETFDAVRRIRPDIPFILVSGFDEAKAMEDKYERQPQAFLPKPFQFQLLKETLERLLK